MRFRFATGASLAAGTGTEGHAMTQVTELPAGAAAAMALAERMPGGAITQRRKLSLVVPCYNEERTLEGCLDSVLAIQDETLELEIIVVDDCSKDDSWNVAKRLAERIPNLVVLHHEKN